MMLSDEAMQELLRIELLQQVMHKPIAHSILKTSVRLHPKPESELVQCIEKIRHHAEQVDEYAPQDILEAANRARSEDATAEELIAFAKLYYPFWLGLGQAHLSSR